MQNFDLVGTLAFVTIGAVLVIGIVSWMRAKKAEDNHEDAAVAERQRHEDAAAPVEGTPGHIDPTIADHDGGSAARGNQARSGDDAAPTDSGRSWSKDRGANPPTPMAPRN